MSEERVEKFRKIVLKCKFIFIEFFQNICWVFIHVFYSGASKANEENLLTPELLDACCYTLQPSVKDSLKRILQVPENWQKTEKMMKNFDNKYGSSQEEK